MSVDLERVSKQLRDEADFADSQYAPFANRLAINQAMYAKYSHPCRCWDHRQRAAMIMGDLRGKSLLDLGCGMGEEAVYFAKLGAVVTAIDISPVGIKIARDRAHFNSVDVDARQMQIPTTFADSSFDVIHGLGIVHHVGVQQTLQEVKRLLKPGGRAVFFEPMGNCPPLEKLKNWLHRRLVSPMSLLGVTEHERPVVWRELLEYRDLFEKFELYPYNLITRIHKFLPRGTRSAARITDHYTLRWAPFLRYFAGGVLLSVIAKTRLDNCSAN